MIKTFASKETAAVFAGLFVRRLPPSVLARAKLRLEQLHGATCVEDLRLPSSNHLKALSGTREGCWSIRINQQWRICFRFENGDAFEVEIVDYH